MNIKRDSAKHFMPLSRLGKIKNICYRAEQMGYDNGYTYYLELHTIPALPIFMLHAPKNPATIVQKIQSLKQHFYLKGYQSGLCKAEEDLTHTVHYLNQACAPIVMPDHQMLNPSMECFFASPDNQNATIHSQ